MSTTSRTHVCRRMSRGPASRREFVTFGAVGLAAATLGVGCGSREPAAQPPPPPPLPDTGSADVEDGRPTPSCDETDDNILGPYYRPGAPTRSDLVETGMTGVRLTVRGDVLGVGCKAPIAGALLDIWQADNDGAYDPTGFRLRGKIVADAAGKFTLKTIIPGHYLNGGTYRPAHIHVKVTAPGFRELTTQLYFEGDKFNATDPFIKPRLIIKLTDEPPGQAAKFSFVLAKT